MQYALSLDCKRFYSLFNAINVVEAQETLRLMLVADWPNLNKNDRKRIDKDLRKQAYPIQSKREGKALSNDQIATILGMR